MKHGCLLSLSHQMAGDGMDSLAQMEPEGISSDSMLSALYGGSAGGAEQFNKEYRLARMALVDSPLVRFSS